MKESRHVAASRLYSRFVEAMGESLADGDRAAADHARQLARAAQSAMDLLHLSERFEDAASDVCWELGRNDRLTEHDYIDASSGAALGRLKRIALTTITAIDAVMGLNDKRVAVYFTPEEMARLGLRAKRARKGEAVAAYIKRKALA